MSTLGSEYYQPGDVIYRGESFLSVIHHDLWDKICANCNINTDLKSCGACGIMKYCGKRCQKIDWPDHKLECPLLRNRKNVTNRPLIQLIGNVILKLKGRDWKTITDRLIDQEISFDDLISHTGTTHDVSLLSDFKVIKDDVEAYIGKENLPNEKILIEIIGKVTIAYGNMINTVDSFLTLKKVKNGFLGACYCNDCSQPIGKSALTHIIDEAKADSVQYETDATLQLICLLVLLKYPIDIVTRDKLSQLLQKQEGVLGKTNLRRIQILAIKALFKDGPDKEMKKDLVELANTMKEVWGEYFEELIPVYQKLRDISAAQNNFQECNFYCKKILQLYVVCYGFLINEESSEEFFIKAINHIGMNYKYKY